MKLIALFIIACLVGCGVNNSSIEERFKKYMKDSVVENSFNDPTSYEFISIKIDTTTNHKFERLALLSDSLKLLDIVEKIEKDSLDGITNARELRHNSLDILNQNILRYQRELSEPDYVYKINGLIQYRAKNKLGVKIIDQAKLYYLPTTDKIQQAD